MTEDWEYGLILAQHRKLSGLNAESVKISFMQILIDLGRTNFKLALN